MPRAFDPPIMAWLRVLYQILKVPVGVGDHLPDEMGNSMTLLVPSQALTFCSARDTSIHFSSPAALVVPRTELF